MVLIWVSSWQLGQLGQVSSGFCKRFKIWLLVHFDFDVPREVCLRARAEIHPVAGSGSLRFGVYLAVFILL